MKTLLGQIQMTLNTSFKLIKGKNGTTIFLPLNTKIGGLVKYAKDKETICLTEHQARHL